MSQRERGAPKAKLTALGQSIFSAGLVTLAIAWTASDNRAMLAGALLAAAPLVARRAAARSLRGIAASLHAPAEVGVRERFPLEVRLEKAAATGDAFGVSIAAEPLRFDAGPAFASALVAGGGPLALRTTASLSRRGEILVPGVRLSTSFPLGLAHATADHGSPLAILALPRPLAALRARAAEFASAPAATADSAATAPRPSRADGEFHALVPWRPPMPARSIHARASARRGEPFARRFDAAPRPEVAVAFDAAPPAAGDVRFAARFERAVRAAATLAVRAERDGARRIAFFIGSGRASTPRDALRRLATVSPSPLATPDARSFRGETVWISPARREAPPGARTSDEIERAMEKAPRRGEGAR